LQEKLKTNENLRNFLELNQKCEQATLESYLIMPIQRLPRYLLLLEELIKTTKPDDSSLLDIKEAYDKIKRVATGINESLHQKEAQMQVLKIQQMFEKDSRYIDLVTPTRQFVKEGVLKKKFSKFTRQMVGWKDYSFFLFNDILLYASKTGIAKATYRLKHVIYLYDLSVEPLPEPKGEHKQLEFKSKTGKSFVVMGEHKEERDSWYHAIQAHIEKIHEDSKNFKYRSFDGVKTVQRTAKLAALTGVTS